MLELSLLEIAKLELSLLATSTLELLAATKLLTLLDEDEGITITTAELELSLELFNGKLLPELLDSRLATLLALGISLELIAELVTTLEELLTMGSSPVGTLELFAGGLSLPPPPPHAPSDKTMISAQHARKENPVVNFIENLQFFIAIIF